MKPSLSSLLAAAAAGFLLFRHLRLLDLRRRERRVRTDARIARDVRESLGRIVRAGSIGATVEAGVVALHGTVARNRRDRLLRAALAIPGVKSVVNRLEVAGDPDNLEGWQTGWQAGGQARGGSMGSA